MLFTRPYNALYGRMYIMIGCTVIEPGKPKLLEQVRQKIQLKHMSVRTEEAYVYWIRDFLRYHKNKTGDWQHPSHLYDSQVNQYLT